MVRNRIAGLTTILALTIGAGILRADEKFQLANILANKLGLNNDQKAEIQRIHTDFEMKMEPLEQQLCADHHQARTEVMNVLTEQQRAKAPEVIKEMRDKEMQSIGAKLGLNDQQRRQVEKTWAEYEKKFEDLAAQKPEDVRKQFHELKHELFSAVCSELTDEERARIPNVLRAEFHQWRSPAFRTEHLKAFEEKLALNADQKTQVEKVFNQFNQRVEKPIAQLKELHQQACTATEKVMTEEQRTKFKELIKNRGE